MAAREKKGGAYKIAPSLQVTGQTARAQLLLQIAKSINDRFPPKVYCYNQIITLHANTFGERQEREQSFHLNTSSWV